MISQSRPPFERRRDITTQNCSRRVLGGSMAGTSSVLLTSGFVSGAAMGISPPFEVLLNADFRITDCPPQFDLGHVVRVKTRNQRLVCAGNRLLCLDHFDVVRHAGGETVAGLYQCLVSQIDGAA